MQQVAMSNILLAYHVAMDIMGVSTTGCLYRVCPD